MEENKPATTPTNKPATLNGILANPAVQSRFQAILGQKANAFMSSIISATKANPALAKCNPDSVIQSAVIAATLDLPIQGNLGFAYIIPYGKEAQFQMGYKGYIQLAMRSGQFKTINVTEVCEGELVKSDKFTGEYEFDASKKTSDKVIGYVAYFRLINGFEKTLFSTVEDVEKHAKKYSQTYKKGFGKWKDDFDSMAKKTVLKLLLSKYGILSVQMEKALTADQAVVKDAETMEVEYVDNNEDVTAVTEEQQQAISGVLNTGETEKPLNSLLNEHKPGK